MNADARQQGRIYQVGSGTMHIVNNSYYGVASTQPEPLGLSELRDWIDQALADYRNQKIKLSKRERAAHEKDLLVLKQLVSSQDEKRADKDAVRRLAVAGIVEYITIARAAATPLSGHAVLDLAVFTLWPVVQAPRLPAGWEYDLAELTSPRLARVVAETRNAMSRGHNVSCENFTRLVAMKPFGRAISALMEDLSDPKKGGAVVTAVALANRLPAPPTRKGPRAALAWFVAGVATASISGSDEVEAIVADAVSRIWAWSAGPGSEQPDLSSSDGGEGKVFAGKSARGGGTGDDSAFDEMMEEIVDSFFN